MFHLLRMLVIFICTYPCFGNPHYSPKYECSVSDRKALAISINHYVATKTAITPNNVIIKSERCVGSYASAILHPRKRITDDAVIYLRKINNHWQVLSLGTAFDEKFLSQLPEPLRKP